jgi:hypothetical protein
MSLVEKWCRWMFSIPKNVNPTLDLTGEHASINQTEPWFLTGSFGNIEPIIRRCTIPADRSIFFPVIEKEDSFIDDTDLETELELVKRCTHAMDQVIRIEVSLDDQKIAPIRMRSKVFDLTYPENNVYDVQAGRTRSVCDGYWVFLNPLSTGRHLICFSGEAILEEAVADQERTRQVYQRIWQHMDDKNTFRLNISYDLHVF